MSDSTPAIVLGHGQIAQALVSAVELITGVPGRFVALSNDGLGTREIEEMLEERLDATGARVVFTDLPAGSCNFAACHLLRGRMDIVVVTGVNLPALLHFATHSEPGAVEGAEQAAERGAAAMHLLRGKPA
jgi:N-acetylgalactosamine PTS system EIIA component